MVELYAPGMRAAGLEVTLDAPEPAQLTGNRQLLAQLITNLLENALKYVPAGGRVQVRVRNTTGGIHAERRRQRSRHRGRGARGGAAAIRARR